MSIPVPANTSNVPRIDPETWRPAASPDGWAARARVLRQIREFFFARGVLEVETPILSRFAAPDASLDPIGCALGYLSTSPETAMKRLVAAGSGSIYQITRAFRAGESGPLHNPEFTMLEWYRPGWNWRELIDESVTLALEVLGTTGRHEFTFAEAFTRFAGIDPFADDWATLRNALPGPIPEGLERLELLDLLLTERVEPAFAALDGVVVLTRFPAERAAMAIIDSGPPATALRFELYARGVELVNGYQELTDPDQQEARLLEANAKRAEAGKLKLPIDGNFLDALRVGMPKTAGAALGVDRLVMLAMGAGRLAEVMAFPEDRA
ncbi:Elongation factor P--(R)-beta-lysine ligase [Candidatus Magnetaquicoccaceae bacterium FCR-1]|uniref:Elongation factor P--(R)-beta-lysine ligase n=1 Tax=Candidatus Magnetaquiglobus chichijimensis TaxID=3141448 RepID=A0ABQ0C8U6_9PROT